MIHPVVWKHFDYEGSIEDRYYFLDAGDINSRRIYCGVFKVVYLYKFTYGTIVSIARSCLCALKMGMEKR